jgi:hypothetical protein
VLDHQILSHGPLKRPLPMVVVVHTQRHRYDPGRFQTGFLFRGAKPFTSLSDCQARSKTKLDFHLGASLSTMTFAKLEVRHQSSEPSINIY